MILADKLEAKFLQFLLLLLDISQLIKDINFLFLLSFIFILLPKVPSIADKRMTSNRCLLPPYIPIFTLIPPREKLMLVRMITEDPIDCIANLTKIIHVELPDKGVVVAMLEIFGKHFFGEFREVED